MYKLFSQRMKEQNGEMDDVYTYNFFPEGFRNQFLHIVEDVFDQKNFQNYYQWNGYHNIDFWHFTCCAFAREKGLKVIAGRYSSDVNNDVAFEYYVDTASDEDFLDLMDFTINVSFSKEIICKYISEEIIEDGIEELNDRFRQHMLGYEVVEGKLIVKTNEQTHQNIVKPAIKLLHNKEFAGAEQEFFTAFDCYKQNNNKDAILNLIKCFESVLKIICKGMKYHYEDKKDTAKELLNHLKDNGFYPSYLESHLTGIRTTLESGAPTLRNKEAGHGQGDKVVNVSDEYVEYALNLVATNIVFLVKLYNKQVKNK